MIQFLQEKKVAQIFLQSEKLVYLLVLFLIFLFRPYYFFIESFGLYFKPNANKLSFIFARLCFFDRFDICIKFIFFDLFISFTCFYNIKILCY
ncbi:MAG: hypothetical protein COC02_06380 [Rhodospirillaceae bacterium]|nr:MAG: hypothetical protein COC02_06380 [Rhodospirillaceae bacterium]